MAHKKMTATGPLRYGTRMLQAGDAVTLSGPQARLYEALGKVEPPQRAKKRPAPAPRAAGDDLSALRAEYKAKLGKNPFNGWAADTLREKIAAA